MVKKLLIIVLGVILVFGLSGCGKGKEEVTENTVVETIEVHVTDKISTADIWIIPDTETNRKASLWGTAAIADLAVDHEGSGPVEKSEDGKYLLRIIDEDEMYYAADAVSLEAGQSIVIEEGDGKRTITAGVYDQAGNKLVEYEMFAAHL